MLTLVRQRTLYKAKYFLALVQFCSTKIRLALLFGSIYQHFTFLETATGFTCFFLSLKITLFNTVQWCRVIWAVRAIYEFAQCVDSRALFADRSFTHLSSTDRRWRKQICADDRQ